MTAPPPGHPGHPGHPGLDTASSFAARRLSAVAAQRAPLHAALLSSPRGAAGGGAGAARAPRAGGGPARAMTGAAGAPAEPPLTAEDAADAPRGPPGDSDSDSDEPVSPQAVFEEARAAGFVPCKIKTLPPELLPAAARRAFMVNPANAPSPGVSARIAAAVPSLDKLDHRARMALLTDSKWRGNHGVHLNVAFLDPSVPLVFKQRVLYWMNAWSAYCNAQFTLVDDASEAEVRISVIKDGHWSYVGTDILSIPQDRATMNLELTMDDTDAEFERVVCHETGHTLGFVHEHQRQDVVMRINRRKAFAYFEATQGWDAETTTQQVLSAYPMSVLTASATPDPISIMCYWLPGNIMRDGVTIQGGTTINELDAKCAGDWYPLPGGSW